MKWWVARVKIWERERGKNVRFVLHEKRSWDESFYSNFKMNLRDFINRAFKKVGFKTRDVKVGQFLT